MFYYDPATGKILDSTNDIEADANYERLHQLRQKHNSEVVLLSWEEVQQRQHAFYAEKIDEITESAWTEALEVLPPVGWHNYGSWEVFKLSELLTGSLTRIYVRKGDRYYRFVDDVTLPARDCLRRVEAML